MASQKKIVTSGAPSFQSTVPLRLEINDMKDNHPKQWSLYIQALNKWYNDLDEDRDDSLFGIGSIHGLPFKQWNKAGDAKPATQYGNGYCQHHTVLFPSWHRPYMALFEQILNKYALEVAATFTSDREEWLKEAAQLRAPYWDWASSALPPEEVYDYKKYPKVSVTLPDGSSGLAPNPLLSYKFKSGRSPQSPEGWLRDPEMGPVVRAINSQPATVRNPDAPGGPIEGFKTSVGGYKDNVYRTRRTNTANILLNGKDWTSFSTSQVFTTRTGRRAFTNSLENIHDGLHGAIGGVGGHMSITAWAAFDPIFWLHHCNVDRMLALWQTIHPGVWNFTGENGIPTWDLPDGVPITQTTDLMPFRSGDTPKDDQWWTSVGCQKWKQMQYTYPDFANIDLNNEAAASITLKKKVEDDFQDVLLGRRPWTGQPEALRANTFGLAAPQPVLAASSTKQTGSSAGESKSSELVDWTVRIRCKKVDAINIDSFVIFLGGIPDDSSNNVADERYVGAWNPFVNPFTSLCRNCVATTNVRIEGFVHLTESLLDRGIDVDNVPVVEEYLKSNLKWVPVTARGTFARLEDVPSLEVLVFDTPLEPRDDWSSPEVGEVRKHNEITFDQPGGRVRDPSRA